MKNTKKVLLAVAAFTLCALSFSSHASNKIDPLLEIMAARGPKQAATSMKAFGVASSSDGVVEVEALVKSGPDVGAAVEAIESAGGKVGLILGDILTVSMPLDAVAVLENEPDIIYVEAAKPLSAKMNFARTVTFVDLVQSGSGTGGTPYNGSGVFVGVVDSGIDCQHADFFSGTTPRIYAYWDQTASGDGVAEIAGTTGVEYTGADLDIDGACKNSPDDPASNSGGGHGTHVAGIAAGSNSTYTGVAPQSNLVVVKLDESGASGGTSGPLATRILEGVQYIFKKAQSLKKPAVVNLSIGTSLGAHDGTSLLEKGLDNLLMEDTTTEKQGRAIVNAVGNENAYYNRLATGNNNIGGIHAAISQSGGSSWAYEIHSTNATAGLVGGTYVDIWLNADSSCSIGVNALYKDAHSLAVRMIPVRAGYSNKNSPTKIGNVSMYVDFSENVSALNGMQHAVALIGTTSPLDPQIENYSYDLVFTGNCTGNAWIYYDSVAYNYFYNGHAGQIFNDGGVTYRYVAGDSNNTATIPSTATKVIAVGSFMARNTYVDINDQVRSLSYGSATNISTFSSLGPTSEPISSNRRYKPDIGAPGEPIISTLTTQNTVSASLKGDATHWKMQGSSMASPHVAGVVALMLNRNGCLHPSDIKTTLLETADRDSYTGDRPNYAWGYGKVNAQSAVNSTEARICSPDNPAEDGCVNDDDCPSGYSCVNNVCQKNTTKTCSLILSGTPQKRSWTDVLSLLFGIAVVGALRARKYFDTIR